MDDPAGERMELPASRGDSVGGKDDVAASIILEWRTVKSRERLTIFL